ncbi:MAG TPA: hypothetical protein PKC25_15620, partial [Candidatus Rifleibacterium sp.]|nr:hypothetical protein [Candidatus Rifleibacterium sp.]
MKLIRLILLVSAVLFVISGPATAQEAPQFGYVNVADAVMLHPLMKEFDASARRFKLSALKGDQEGKGRERRQKAESEVKTIQAEIEKLGEEKKKIENTYLENLKKLQGTKLSGATSGKSQDQYNKEKARIDSAFFGDSRNLNQEIQKLQARLNELNISAEYAGHASFEETSQVFSLILDDVYEGVEAVSKFYKIGFVFNSSFEFARISSKMLSVNPMPEFFGNISEKLNEEEGKLTLGAALNA